MRESTLFDGHPRERALYETIRRYIESLGDDVRVEPKKTQVSFKAGTGFAFVWLPLPNRGRPEHSVVLSFGLGHRVEDERIVEAVEPAPGRWTHHIIIEQPSDLDAAVKGWLREAYAFGRADRRKRRREQ